MLPQTGCAQRAANSQGLAYDLARERALKLVPMMSTAQVQSLLGPPNQTGFQMLGGVPWAVGSMGQVWTYEWKPNELETKKLDRTLLPEIVNSAGSGTWIDVAEPFLLVIFHPTTTEYGSERPQMEELLNALGILKTQTILLWPNIDAGADHISKAIRVFRDRTPRTWLWTLTNLSPENYLKVLSNASCAIGNSSSFVRDASYFGTPVVLAGARQDGREIDEHVLPSAMLAPDIVSAVKTQLTHGRYRPSTLYGDGRVAERIAESLARLTPYVQKRLHYVYEAANGTNESRDTFSSVQPTGPSSTSIR
jgi:hypothetical protein